MMLMFILAYLCMTVFYNGRKGKHPTLAKWFFYGGLALFIASAAFGGYCGYHLRFSKDAYATRAYHAAVELGQENPEEKYAEIQNEWSEDKRLTRAKVKHLEEEVKQLSLTPEDVN